MGATRQTANTEKGKKVSTNKYRKASKLLDQNLFHTLLNMQIILVSNFSTSSNWLCVIADSMILLASVEF